MALLQRYNGDFPRRRTAIRLDQIHGEDGVWTCTAVGICSEVCPKAGRSGQRRQSEQDQQRAGFLPALMQPREPAMSERRPFHRPQPRRWWAHKPYLAYTLRELSGVAVAAYGAILLAGLICLWRGPEAYAAYRRILAATASLVVHLVLLAGCSGTC